MPHPLTFANDRLPGFRCGAAWIGTLAVATMLLGGAESYWRSQGFLPFVPESRDLWAYHRSRVYGRKTVVLLGASIMRTSFSTDRFRERFPDHRVVQLAVDGRNPYATLCDLADDPGFHGLVITNGFPRAVSSDATTQAYYVEHFHQYWSQDLLTKSGALNFWGNRLLLWLLQDRLVIANPPVNLRQALTHLQSGTAFRSPSFATPRFDRSVLADYSKVKNLAALRNANLAPYERHEQHKPLDDLQPWIENATELKPIITRLERRGGRAVFVHFPVTDELERQTELRHPKRKYWDRLADVAGATTIHYREVPGMFGFEIPDMAHIDQRDAPKFTGALLDELVRRGLLPLE